MEFGVDRTCITVPESAPLDSDQNVRLGASAFKQQSAKRTRVGMEDDS